MGRTVGSGSETVARAKEAWFHQVLELENGISSHDTFGDVLAKIDSEAFQTRFMRWVGSVFRVTKRQVVARMARRCAAATNAARSKRRSIW
jgi:hypothetical protein